MKILHTVEFYHPSIGGMQEVVKQISEHLVKFGHEVTIATTRLPERTYKELNGVKIVDFNVSGNLARGLSGDIDSYRRFILNSEFDIITNFAAQQWATDAIIQITDSIKAKKVFVPTGFSGLYDTAYKHYFESMKVWMKKYDVNIFLSNDYRDINFARNSGVKNCVIIPNGASQDEFLAEVNIDIRSKLGISKEEFLIINVSSHTGIKGHQEAIDIFNQTKIKNAVFLMIANSFEQGCNKSCKQKELRFKKSIKRLFDRKKLIITSLTREETIAAYKEAELFLFTSNIECSPIVLFECMASKTPFLTTDVGNAKEIIDWCQAGLLLPTLKNSRGYSKAKIKESARVLKQIYIQNEQRELMKTLGFGVWTRRFTWDKVSREYEKLYFSLLEV